MFQILTSKLNGCLTASMLFNIKAPRSVYILLPFKISHLFVIITFAPFGLPALIGNSYENLQDDIKKIGKLENFFSKNYVVVYTGRLTLKEENHFYL